MAGALAALVLDGEAAEVAGAEGAVVGVGVFVVVVVRFWGGGCVALGPPAVAAGEDVLNALVGGELGGLAGPGRGERAPVEVLDLGDVPSLGYARQRWGDMSAGCTRGEDGGSTEARRRHDVRPVSSSTCSGPMRPAMPPKTGAVLRAGATKLRSPSTWTIRMPILRVLLTLLSCMRYLLTMPSSHVGTCRESGGVGVVGLMPTLLVRLRGGDVTSFEKASLSSTYSLRLSLT